LFNARTLNVPNTKNFLRIAIRADKEKFQPGEKVTLTISVKDDLDAPADAELLVSGAPESLFSSRDPMPGTQAFYYGDTGITQITTADSFQFEFPHEGEFLSLPLASDSPRLRNMSEVAPKLTEARPQSRLLSFVYPTHPTQWNAHLGSGPDGKALTELEMPHTTLRWRVTVVAIDRLSRVGEAYLVLQSTTKD
jgi:uncharacterized protein YfaS (alpha-2-macroglobulin family)